MEASGAEVDPLAGAQMQSQLNCPVSHRIGFYLNISCERQAASSAVLGVDNLLLSTPRLNWAEDPA